MYSYSIGSSYWMPTLVLFLHLLWHSHPLCCSHESPGTESWLKKKYNWTNSTVITTEHTLTKKKIYFFPYYPLLYFKIHWLKWSHRICDPCCVYATISTSQNTKKILSKASVSPSAGFWETKLMLAATCYTHPVTSVFLLPLPQVDCPGHSLDSPPLWPLWPPLTSSFPFPSPPFIPQQLPAHLHFRRFAGPRIQNGSQQVHKSSSTLLLKPLHFTLPPPTNTYTHLHARSDYFRSAPHEAWE